MTIFNVRERLSIAHLFTSCDKVLIQSYLQGYMGHAYVDSLTNPQSALIILGEFYFFAGIATAELVSFKPNNYCEQNAIMVPPNQRWSDLIVKIYGARVKHITRYSFKSNTLFDVNNLNEIQQQLASQYQLKIIDENLYQQILFTDWAKDLCSNFKTYTQFKRLGIGVVVLKNAIIVAGASSYIVYKQGIEIEVDTKKTERCKGLATICSAKLILMCLDNHIYPNWDAHNEISLHLAQKLGYQLNNSYSAYVVGY